MSHRPWNLWIWIVVVTSFASFAAMTRAEDKPAAAPPTTHPAGVDPRADDILRRMGQTLTSAKTFSFAIHDMIDEVLENGQKVQFSKNITVTVRRPDGIVAEVKGDMEDLRFVYDAKKLMLFNRLKNCYALQDVPDNIDDMFDFLATKFGITAPLSDIMFADPYQTLIERVRQGGYLGVHMVGDVKCHHLAFRQDGLDWQIWIEDSERPLPRKIVLTYKEQPGHPQFIALLDKWDLSPKLPENAFSLTPPPGAKRQDLVSVEQSAQPNDTKPSESKPAGKP